MSVVAPGAAIWAVATRICLLDVNGFVAAGANTFVTETLMKATLTPVTEAGDDIAIKDAAGNLSAWGRHGDMIKYGTVNIELTRPDPQLEQILAGGVVLNDSGAALSLPTGLTVTGQTTLGMIAAGTYGYRATQYNAYGESLAEAEVDVTNTGGTSMNVLSGVTPAAGALGIRYYGRVVGGEQLLGQRVAIGSQSTNAATGTAPTSITLTALTKPIPAGFEFQIAGDSNTPKITFKTTAGVGVGAISVPVTYNQGAGGAITTIAAAAIQPVFVDDGSITPSGALPASDLTAGPGTGVGYQMAALGPVSAPNGVSIEFFSKRMVGGYQATDWPYWRTVLPRVANLHIMPRDFTNANMQTILEGQAFQNPNWSSGPVGDWQFDSTKMAQRAVCGAQIVPAASLSATLAEL